MILVVGGAGYIGSHTNLELNKKGYKTVVFDNLVYGHEDFVKWGEFVQGDLGDIKKIRETFEKFPITAVMHFAAFAYVGESVNNPEKYYMNNVSNTLNLLKVMRENNVDTIVFSSTCATYGIPTTVPISENTIQNPINSYGQSKLMVEKILMDFNRAYGTQYVSLRYFNAAGADPTGEIGEKHDPETHLIPLVLDVAIGRRNYVEIFGIDYDTLDGTCIRDYIHVTDIANAHIQALRYLEHDGEPGCFNLGNGLGYSVKQVIETASKITGRDIKVIESDRREGDPAKLIADSRRAKEILKWQPLYSSLDSIIETAWQWHKIL